MIRGLIVAAILVAGHAEVIDRIAVSVGNQVITTDQIDDELRVTAFLNHTEPDLTPDARKRAAERLIEQTLIKREMDFSHYPLPSLVDADPMVESTEAAYPSHDTFVAALQRYGINVDDLRQHLWWQLTLLKFIDDRFRPAVQVSSAEIRQHYREQVERWKADGLQPIPTFEQSREAMEKAVTEERVDLAVDRWLGDARTRVDIRFRDGVFK